MLLKKLPQISRQVDGQDIQAIFFLFSVIKTRKKFEEKRRASLFLAWPVVLSYLLGQSAGRLTAARFPLGGGVLQWPGTSRLQYRGTVGGKALTVAFIIASLDDLSIAQSIHNFQIS